MNKINKPFFCNQQGTASIEAVVMLPVMAICWAGVFFYLNGFDQQLDAANEARQKAWHLSNNACRSSERQYDCKMPGGETPQESPGWLENINELPIIGWLFGSIFGYSTTANIIRKWQAPPMFGSDPKHSSYSYNIMCNEEKMGIDDILKSMICEQLHAVGVDFGWMDMGCPDARHTHVCSNIQ